MTIFQIITPTGNKVCKIQAVSFVSTETGIYFYDIEASGFKIDNWIAEIPAGWAVIPLNVIVKENEVDKVEHIETYPRTTFPDGYPPESIEWVKKNRYGHQTLDDAAKRARKKLSEMP